jgi:hypothetical protein
LNRLFELNRRVFKAYLLKESLEGLWNYRYRGAMLVLVQRESKRGRSPLVSIPPFGRGFLRHEGLSIRCSFGRAREESSRARDHRLDEPTKLSLGMVASLQSPLPFHLARSL